VKRLGPLSDRRDIALLASAPLAATFINSDPGAVAIATNGQTVALDHVQAASGAHYAGRWNGEDWSFWEHGGEATLAVPGKPAMTCTKS